MSFTPSIISKKIFITFGAGNQNYYDAVDRLTEQASNLNIFDNLHLLSFLDHITFLQKYICL